jgi:hypothetical protein
VRGRHFSLGDTTMITGLIYFVVYIIVLALILWLLNYLIDIVPLQEPFNRVAKIALMVIGVLIVILLLLNFIGILDGGPPRLRP